MVFNINILSLIIKYMIKAVFLDFDGTTFSHVTKKIPDSAYQAILNAQKNNIKIFLATGRDIDELHDFDCRNIQFDGYILDSGLLLLDKDLNTISVNYFEGREKENAIKFFNEKKIPTLIRTKSSGYMNYIDDNTIKVLEDVDSLVPPLKNYDGEDVMVVTAFVKSDEDKRIINEYFNNSTITWWHDNSADILPNGCNKLNGIIKMLHYHKISIDETLTIGDSKNDIEMISGVPHSVAMGNSVQEIKDAAEYVTTDIDDNGLEYAFIKYNII